jgi:hypothetical protein
VLEFAAEWQASLRRLSAATPGDRAACLAGLAAEIRRRIDQFANDGLGRALLAQLRELAADLPGASGGPAPLHRLWLRATDMLEALTATRGQDPGDRAAAFWRRNP